MNTYLKKKHLKKFDPNGLRQKGNLFGLPYNPETASVVVIPVPWDVTSINNKGASLGPKSILDVSTQIALAHHGISNAWELGIAMLPIDENWINKNNQARGFVEQFLKSQEETGVILKNKEAHIIHKNINALSENINDWVQAKSIEILDAGQIPVVLGGDHSSPLGLMKAINDRFNGFGVLHIDARPDLRKSCDGFEYSHASIMYNLLEMDGISRLVQVGVREYSNLEYEEIVGNSRISTYFDIDLKRQMFEGVLWSFFVNQIIEDLPENIYISLDISALEFSAINPDFPVSGGLTYNQLIYLFDKLAQAGKRIIGFDMCEVSGNQSSASALFAARILYYLTNITGVSNKLLLLE